MTQKLISPPSLDWALAAIGRELPAAVASKPRAEDSRNLRLVVSVAICQYPRQTRSGWTHRHSRRITATAVLLPTKRSTSQHCGLSHRVVSKDIMSGYATDETPELMPLPIVLAHRLGQLLAQGRHVA